MKNVDNIMMKSFHLSVTELEEVERKARLSERKRVVRILRKIGKERKVYDYLPFIIDEAITAIGRKK